MTATVATMAVAFITPVAAMPDRAFDNRSDNRSPSLKSCGGKVDDATEDIHQSMVLDRMAVGLAMVAMHDSTSRCLIILSDVSLYQFFSGSLIFNACRVLII